MNHHHPPATTPAPRAVVVYGTLRTTEPNYSLVRNYAPASTVVEVPDFRLVGYGHGFPYALPAPGRTMTGELLTFTPDTWDDALRRMDALEGFPDFYTRRVVTVSTPSGPAAGWTYTPADPEWYEGHQEVPGGDWVKAGGWGHARAVTRDPAADLAAWWESVK